MQTGELLLRKRICIVSFSTIAQDARVLRQVEYLSSYYDITLIAHGAYVPPDSRVTYVPVPKLTALSKLLALLLLVLGKVTPAFYDFWYWSTRRHRAAYDAILNATPDAIHANDWSALPIAVEAAKRNGARVVLDAHEYAPLQFGNRRLRLILYTPAIRYMLAKYAPLVDASITVCAPIAERYRDEYGLQPLVVMNAPKLPAIEVAEHPLDPHRIRLIHHGGAIRDRNLEVMIEALALADERFHLDFMLLPTDSVYLKELKQRATERAPERITFVEPVAPGLIVPTLLDYDIGMGVIDATNYNYLMALPNKFFDFLCAGLVVVIGPSPAMAAVVQQYGVGVIAHSFAPEDIAQTLNSLTAERIVAMKRASHIAAQQLNADAEMGKVVNLYARLINETLLSV